MIQFVGIKIGTKQFPNRMIAAGPGKKRKLSSILTKAYS